jgi:hypothetical protein
MLGRITGAKHYLPDLAGAARQPDRVMVR